MGHSTYRGAKWTVFILASLGGAIIVGFGVKHAIIYYAEWRWPPQEICLTDDPIHVLVRVEVVSMEQLASAARRYYTATGTIPTSQTVLVQHGFLLPDVFHDLFSPRRRPAHYKFRVEGQRLYIWSCGPDKKSDGGVISYDPTNGLVSGGDILAVVEF